jgi:hypothetical protein
MVKRNYSGELAWGAPCRSLTIEAIHLRSRPCDRISCPASNQTYDQGGRNEADECCVGIRSASAEHR